MCGRREPPAAKASVALIFHKAIGEVWQQGSMYARPIALLPYSLIALNYFFLPSLRTMRSPAYFTPLPL